MNFIDKLKEKAKRLKLELTALYYAYQNPGTGALPKIIIIFTLGYALSPIDLIPDFIPVLGYLDDLIIIPALISWSLKLIPAEIMHKSRERASHEPLTLKKNWLFGVIFLLIWLSLLTVMMLAVIRVVQNKRHI